MKIIKNDEAVSPVIGVILMVAITVILAAVIAAFVFGMAGTTQTTKTVSLTVTLTTGAPAVADFGKVTINGGSDLPSLNKLQYSIDSGRTWTSVYLQTGGNTEATQFDVGRVYYTKDKIKGIQIQLKGTFDDGSEQVLLTKQF